MKEIPDEEWFRLFSDNENEGDPDEGDRTLFLKALEKKVPPESATLPASVDETVNKPGRRRLPKKQLFPVDAELDLHGKTTDETNILLERFLMKVRSDGCRIVRIITGKGHHSDRKGILRQHVERWIRSQGTDSITWYGSAPRGMGGAGAWIVGLSAETDEKHTSGC